MRALGFIAAWVSASGLVLPGCTDAQLYGDNPPNPPDQLTVQGSICTDDPSERQFPVRVLFLVDTSIPDADYQALRADSMEKVVRSYSASNYQHGVIRYSGPLRGTPCGLRNLTPDGFTRNMDEAVAGVRCTDLANPGRDIMGALSLANSVISGDILTTPLGLRSRTKYVIILLANGAPGVTLPRQWCNSRNPRIESEVLCQRRYAEAFCSDVQPPPADCERHQYVSVVRNLKAFAQENGVQEFIFNTVYQRDPDAAAAERDDPIATDLLSDLSLNGGGALTRFPGPATCNLAAGDSAGCLYASLNLDSTASIFQRRQFLVSNRNALATGARLEVDSDGDGLADTVEAAIGTSPDLADTDGDALSDHIEHVLRTTGLDPLRHERDDPAGMWPSECPLVESGNPNGFPPDQDRDGDRLTDCEEALLRSDATLFDSDADGLADPLEFRYGTNLIADDGLQDPDADGFPNIQELKSTLDPLSRDVSVDQISRYSIQNEVPKDVLSFTQPFGITGVFVESVSETTPEGRGALVFTPAPDPDAPLSSTNAPRLAWRAPEDTAPGSSPTTPGLGPEVPISSDGEYTLSSAGSTPERPRTLTVRVTTAILPIDPVNDDVRLRRSRRFCFDFEVSGVQLVPTRVSPDTGRGGVNYVDVFLSQVPTNNPTGLGIFRVATVPATLPLDPALRGPQPDIELTNKDFLLYGE